MNVSWSKKTTFFCLTLALCLVAWNGVTARRGEFPPPSASSSRSLFPLGVAGPGSVIGLESAFCDFDGDKLADVARGRWTGDGFSVDIQLTSRTGVTVLRSPNLQAGLSLLVYDINEDDHADIVVTGAFELHPRAVWLGSGAGTFTAVDRSRFVNGPAIGSSASFEERGSPLEQDLLPNPVQLVCALDETASGLSAPAASGIVSCRADSIFELHNQSLLKPRSPPDPLS
jgi:hypothetical protein